VERFPCFDAVITVYFARSTHLVDSRGVYLTLPCMNWTHNIARWRGLPAEAKLRRRWEAIPRDVAQSMAFEGEPVPEAAIRATLDRIEPPAGLKPRAASSATRS
jgi:hypothetical protein